jgi:hypothetical protein
VFLTLWKVFHSSIQTLRTVNLSIYKLCEGQERGSWSLAICLSYDCWGLFRFFAILYLLQSNSCNFRQVFSDLDFENVELRQELYFKNQIVFNDFHWFVLDLWLGTLSLLDWSRKIQTIFQEVDHFIFWGLIKDFANFHNGHVCLVLNFEILRILF